MTHSLGPRSEVLGLLLLLVLVFAFFPRPNCPAEQPSWLSRKSTVACHVLEGADLARLAQARDASERSGDLAAAVHLQRQRVWRLERAPCSFGCAYHHRKHRLQELAELGRLARRRNDQLFDQAASR